MQLDDVDILGADAGHLVRALGSSLAHVLADHLDARLVLERRGQVSGHGHANDLNSLAKSGHKRKH